MWFHILLCTFVIPSCGGQCDPPTGKRLESVFRSGDVIIAGLFPIHNSLQVEETSLRESPHSSICSG